MDSFITYVETEEELELLARWYKGYYSRSRDELINPSGSATWITQYASSKHTNLPAWIGLDRRSPTHNDVNSRGKDALYRKYFRNLPIISVEALCDPDKYPEFYI